MLFTVWFNYYFLLIFLFSGFFFQKTLIYSPVFAEVL